MLSTAIIENIVFIKVNAITVWQSMLLNMHTHKCMLTILLIEKEKEGT